MICFISPDRKKAVELRELLLKSEIFAYHSSFPELENLHGIRDFTNALPFAPSAAIIDATKDCEFGEDMCKALKCRFSNIICITLVDRTAEKVSKFKYVPSSDREIDIFPINCIGEEIKEFLNDTDKSPVRKIGYLDLSTSREHTQLLGYPIALTEAEYRILLFLCTRRDEAVSAELILGFCFAESYRMTLTNVRSHISSINRKAKALSGRKLIISIRGIGYQLNKYM